MGNPLEAQKAIRARELVAVVSPDRNPPLYGQVFQSAAEVERQWSALTSWAVKPSNVIRGRDGSVWPFDVVVESTGSLG